MTASKQVEQLLANSLELTNALMGLQAFIHLRFSSTKLTLTDITALEGLVAAILAQTKMNQCDLLNYFEHSTLSI